MEDGELIVSSTLQTRDRKIFAAGDAATIATPDGGRINPATWPQAAIQGRLAAGNLYRAVPASLNTLTGVNCLNLYPLPIVVLGPPVAGAEVISFFRPGEGVLRELFLTKGEIVGGALVGDISGAGPLNAMMNTGRRITHSIEDLLRPAGRRLPDLSTRPSRRRQAVILPS
jgi:NAD(P)H-nitrite reductase large subunit